MNKPVICYIEDGKEFLAYYAQGKLKDAELEAANINNKRPTVLKTGEPAKCEKRKYFAQMQEEME